MSIYIYVSLFIYICKCIGTMQLEKLSKLFISAFEQNGVENLFLWEVLGCKFES